MDSFGNLFSSDENHKYSTFLQYANFSFYLSSIVSSILFITANDFVRLWMKDEMYVLSYVGVFLFTMNTYYLVSREPLLTVRDVNGLFKETRLIAILSVIVNLGISLLLIKPLGIVGILLGTFVMYYAIDLMMTAKLVYPKVFELSSWKYYQLVINRTGLMFVLTLIGMIIWKRLFPNGVSNMFMWFVVTSGIGALMAILYTVTYYFLFEDFRKFLWRMKIPFLRRK